MTEGQERKKGEIATEYYKLTINWNNNIKKESQSEQSDNYLNLRSVNLQVHRHLPVLTLHTLHINNYDCSQKFSH